MSQPFLGEMRFVAFNFPPKGWAFCNGQTLSIQQNQALFALLGTTYGGNGINNFNLPNMQSRVPVHVGTGLGLSPYTQGQQLGVEAVTLDVTQIPSHTHAVSVNGTAGGQASPSNNFWGVDSNDKFVGYSGSAGSTMNANSVSTAGGSQPHTNLQPYLALSTIISLTGIFPSRN